MGAVSLLPLEASSYRQHDLHRSQRIWTETNCYVDVWVEVLHALGLEPLAACAFALAGDFEGDQWTFFKFPPEDLREIFGIRVFEMNPWHSLLSHVQEQLGSGRLVTLEVDAWYLPDVAGVSYRIDHPKTTIVPNLVDAREKRLGYFHNASYFELDGDDFEGIFRIGNTDPQVLAPYMESIRLDRLVHLPSDELVARSIVTLARQLDEMPDDNPVLRFRQRVDEDLDWLRSAGMEGFHRWAFGTFRQCGASAEVGGAYLEWLAQSSASFDDELKRSAGKLYEVAQACKSLEFQMARLAHGRKVDINPLFDRMAEYWSDVREALRRYVQ